jgi:uncharacterized membrane protein YhhN
MKLMLIWIVAACNILLFLWAYLGSFQPNSTRGSEGRIFPIGRRMVLSFSVVIATLVIWLMDVESDYKMWAFLGMLLSFVGDLSMAKLLPWRNHMIGGMLTFGVAHVLYIIAFIIEADKHAETVFNLGMLIAVVLYALLLIILWLFYIRNPKKPGILNIGALVYGLWVGGTASFAAGLAYALGGGWIAAALGGLLFVISDAIIALTDIGDRRIRNQGVWIWITYIGAQLLIGYASVL